MTDRMAIPAMWANVKSHTHTVNSNMSLFLFDSVHILSFMNFWSQIHFSFLLKITPDFTAILTCISTCNVSRKETKKCCDFFFMLSGEQDWYKRFLHVQGILIEIFSFHILIWSCRCGCRCFVLFQINRIWIFSHVSTVAGYRVSVCVSYVWWIQKAHTTLCKWL